jgi:UDP-3-O-[3-hydroxymyristoyl] glucosamine N-acyltransferase
VTQSIICDGAVIKRGAVVPRGCIISYGAVVGENVVLPEFAKISAKVALAHPCMLLIYTVHIFIRKETYI